MKISEAREQYLADYREKKTGKAAIHHHVTITREFLEFMKTRQAQELEQITPALVEEYRKRLMERVVPMTGKKFSPKTVGSRLVVVRTFLDFVAERGLLAENPGRWIMGGVSHHTGGQVLTAAEMEQVLSKPDTNTPDGLRDRALLEVMYSTGMRSAEVVALDTADVDLEAGRLRVESFNGGPERLAPLTESAREFLGRYLKEVRPAWAQLPGEGQGERRGVALFIEPMRGNHLYKGAMEKIVSAAVHSVKPDICFPCRVIRDACVARLQAEGATMEAIHALLGEPKTWRKRETV